MNKEDKVYWTTKDGRVLDVDDMSDIHIRNAFKMLLKSLSKNLSKSLQVAKPKVDNFQLNGDVAQEFNDSFVNEDELWEDVNFLNH